MKKLLLPAVAVLALSLSGSVLAADAAGTANVTILAAVSVSETTAVNFGSLDIADGTCQMASNGTFSGSCSGTGTPGVMTISGTGSAAVNISVTAGAAVDGVSFAPTVASATGNLSSGSLAVTVYGDMTKASATAGSKALSYTFTTSYQ